MGWLFKKREVEEVNQKPPKKTKLFLLIEEQKQGIIQYFHENGVEVFYVNSDAVIMTNILLAETDYARLVVLDSGKGKFDDRKVLEDISAAVEIVCEIGEVSLFSNRNSFSGLKKKLVALDKEKADKIDVFKSVGVVDVLTQLQQYNEVYSEGGAEDVTPENVLNYKPELINRVTPKGFVPENFDENINLDYSDEDDTLPRYGRMMKHVG